MENLGVVFGTGYKYPTRTQLAPNLHHMKSILYLFRTSPVTMGFVLICTAVYLVMIATGAHFANPHNQAMIAWGGNYRPVTVTGQGWRLLTAMFIHGGWMHLLMNMIALLDIGHVLEQKIGRRMVFVIFLLSGLLGGICSLIWHPVTVGVGASGGIMGLAGALLVWLILPKLDRGTEVAAKAQVRALAVGLTLTLAVGAYSQRIDNAAHAGGLIAGLTLGAIVYAIDSLRSGALKRWAAAVFLMAAGLIVTWYQLKLQSPDEYNFRKPLYAIVNIMELYGDAPSYMQRRAIAENKDMKDFTEEQTGSSFSGDAQRRQNQVWFEQAFVQAISNLDKCIATAQVWSTMRLLPEQKLLASQIHGYCSLRQRQYQIYRHYLRAAPPQQDRELPPLLLQARKLERDMLPQLRLEIHTYEDMHAQLGMTMTGKRKYPVKFGPPQQR